MATEMDATAFHRYFDCKAAPLWSFMLSPCLLAECGLLIATISTHVFFPDPSCRHRPKWLDKASKI